MKAHILALLLSPVFLFACHNNGILDALENPGGEHGDKLERKLYAFVTSQTSISDMTGFTAGPCSGSGMARADCVCNALAQNAGLQGPYIAWLSDSSNEMKCRLFGQTGTGCTATWGTPWYRRDNEPIANNSTELFSGNLQNPISYDENGNSATGTTWTGTQADGTLSSGNTCEDWKTSPSGSAYGTQGDKSKMDSNWTNSGNTSCSGGATRAIYCFAVPTP
ncbi:MAG: hypothetical protein LDLANPLL_02642 [Turneriella sp.]|nr:hypothetical protein [Turneriella sp.]